MSEAPKICIQCKHYRLNRASPPGSEHRCDRPKIDLVTGKEMPHDTICESERSNFNNCGPDGKFWESRV